MARMLKPQDSTKIACVNAGPHLMAVSGFERDEQNGKERISVRFVCLADLTKGQTDDKGFDAFDQLYLTESAMWRFQQFAWAAGQREPFDLDSDDDVEKVVTKAPIVVDLQPDTYQGKTRMKAAGYSAWDKKAVKKGDDWDEIMDAAAERFEEGLKKRAQRAASGNSGGGQQQRHVPDSDLPYAGDDEIPF